MIMKCDAIAIFFMNKRDINMIRLNILLKIIPCVVLSLPAFAVVSAQKAHIYTTTEDGTKLLSETVMNTTIGSPTTNYVRINAAKNNQMIDGFGFALTGGSCYNLMRMSAEERATLLTKIFSESRGYGASYVRISIGCSDFSRSRYTLCDTKGIEHFALQSEETDYVIPVLREVMAINPKL